MKILLIDDNQQFGDLLQFRFTNDAQVVHCKTIEEAINSIFQPDVLLIDVNLGTDKAYNFMELLLNKYDVPILAISSELERTTKFMMFETGVVDYIEKPVDFEILKLKLNNLVTVNSHIISFANLNLNSDNLTINNNVKLSKNEFIILKHFMINSEKIIDKRELLRLLWENEAFVEETALITLISRLRKKIVEVDQSIEIKSIRNQGIRFGLKC